METTFATTKQLLQIVESNSKTNAESLSIILDPEGRHLLGQHFSTPLGIRTQWLIKKHGAELTDFMPNLWVDVPYGSTGLEVFYGLLDN